MKKMKKMLSVLLMLSVVLTGAAFLVPAQAASAVTLSTEDSNTLVDLTALGLSGSSYSIAQNASLSFQLTVPETEASKYITVIRATAACTVKMDIVSSGGTTVFSKTQEMFRAGGDLFAGTLGHNKDLEGAVMELAADTYTVTLTNPAETAVGFVSLEFRDVVLPLGNEKTAFHVTDGYYQYNMSYHTSSYSTVTYTVPDGIKTVGGRSVYSVLMHQVQGAHMKYYVYAETAGQYEFSVRNSGTGGFAVKANDDVAITVNDNESVTHDWRFDTATETITLNQGLNTVSFYAINGGQTSAGCFILEPARSAVTLNTEDTHTEISIGDMGLSGDSYAIPVNESVSYRLIVPQGEASDYLTIIYGGAANDVVQVDITTVDGTSVFSKTHTMVKAGGGIVSGKSGYDGAEAVVSLAGGSYTVTITNLSTGAYTLTGMEFRDVVLPLGMEKTVFHITDAYSWWLPWYHSAFFIDRTELTFDDAKIVGGNQYNRVLIDKAQNGYMFLSVYAEKAGKYKLSSYMDAGTGQLQVKVNSSQTVAFPVVAEAGLIECETEVTLVEGLNKFDINTVSGQALPYNMFMELQDQAEEDYADITLNTEDTHTLVDVAAMGLSGESYSLAQNKKIGFDLIVPASEASKYIAILRGNTTGPVIKLEITDADGNAVFSKSQDITLAYDLFSGVSGQGADLDSGVIELAAGTYTVTIQNTSDTAYDFVSLELRDAVLPLGEGLTAFHTTDAYYQNLLWWHSSRFNTSQSTPYGATAVGGDDFYSIVFKQQNSPDVRYYIYAEEAGSYEISVRTMGCGGIVATVNDDTPVTVVAAASVADSAYRTDTYDGTITLNQGLNTIAFSSVGSLIETSFDCFMLEKVESVWAESNALVITDIQEKSLTLAWNLRLPENVSSFEIYKDGAPAGTAEGTAADYTFTDLTSATSYELAVKAIMKDGSDFDTERTITAYTGNFLARENAFTQISAGRSHLIGINKNGKLQSFGSNTHGQAGSLMTAEPVMTEAGANSSYAVDKDGNAYSWGSNFFGQLGLGTEEISKTAPTKIEGLSGVVQIAAGNEHALALTANGEVYAWGNNRYGQLGTGDMHTAVQKNAPAHIAALSGKGVIKIAAGNNVSYAITADGTLYSWGANYLGQLGDGDAALDNKDVPTAITISDMKVLEVAGGGSHTAAICYSDANSNNTYDSGETKAVYVWGADSRAQLGAGDFTNWQNTPKRQTDLDGVDAIAVAAGDAHTLVLTADGAVYSWGWNEDGQLGLGTLAYAFRPTRVYNIPAITAISAGYSYSVAMAEDGRTYAWGTNMMQQVTDSASAYYNSPVVMNLSLENISIGALKFTNESGETEVKPQTGGTYTVSANCYNDSEAAFSGVIHVCVYQLENGKPQLLTATPVNMQIAGKEQKPLSSEMQLPAVTDNVIVKIFAWDTGVTPYSDAAIVK